MESREVREVFENFASIESDFAVSLLTSGHINATYRVDNGNKSYILQKVNTQVFQNLKGITQNIKAVAETLKARAYPHPILEPLPFKDGNFLYKDSWRIFPFITNTQTFEKAKSPEQAYRAAQFLGEFYGYLEDLDLENITDSIPGFTDFDQRIAAFHSSLDKATSERLAKAEDEVAFLKSQTSILEDWNQILPKLPQRLIHADPKISNFLFDADDENKIVALIDWDTLMCGTVLYDFGDMVRSYTNLKEEDNPDTGLSFNKSYFQALEKGFLESFGMKMEEIEKRHLLLAGKTVIYVQAIRFLTDYLNGDIYFSVKHPEHNLQRAQNQINLLKEILYY